MVGIGLDVLSLQNRLGVAVTDTEAVGSLLLLTNLFLFLVKFCLAWERL